MLEIKTMKVLSEKLKQNECYLGALNTLSKYDIDCLLVVLDKQIEIDTVKILMDISKEKVIEYYENKNAQKAADSISFVSCSNCVHFKHFAIRTEKGIDFECLRGHMSGQGEFSDVGLQEIYNQVCCKDHELIKLIR